MEEAVGRAHDLAAKVLDLIHCDAVRKRSREKLGMSVEESLEAFSSVLVVSSTGST